MRTQPATNSSSIHEQSSDLTFIIGQDRKGHWIALETHGSRGGIFATKDAAIDYAELETGRRATTIRLTAEPLELRI